MSGLPAEAVAFSADAMAADTEATGDVLVAAADAVVIATDAPGGCVELVCEGAGCWVSRVVHPRPPVSLHIVLAGILG